MSDLQKYIRRRKKSDPDFAKNYEAGYADFEMSALLRSIREEAGLTQEDLAEKMGTQKSAISRMEKSKNIHISTLFKLAAVLGKRVHIRIA